MCELADAETIYRRPAHPCTRVLLSAAPEPDPDRARKSLDLLAGELPSPVNPPSGCRFRTRCPYAQPRCAQEVPKMREIAPGQQVACHFPLQ